MRKVPSVSDISPAKCLCSWYRTTEKAESFDGTVSNESAFRLSESGRLLWNVIVSKSGFIGESSFLINYVQYIGLRKICQEKRTGIARSFYNLIYARLPDVFIYCNLYENLYIKFAVFYFAYSATRLSRMTLTLIWPGYSISSSIFLASSRLFLPISGEMSSPSISICPEAVSYTHLTLPTTERV